MKHIATIAAALALAAPVFAEGDSLRIDIGAHRTFSAEESTAAVSVIGQRDLGHRSARNIGHDIVGQGLGLFSKEQQGTMASAALTVRGLQSLTGSSPLILVDGIARDLGQISAEEVESVSILKDGAALALYGHDAANGAVLITTKRGTDTGRHVKFSYDHVYNYLTNKPRFVDAYTNASAINEARTFEGMEPLYTQDEMNAFKSGQYPELYPNVNWVGETFRNHGVQNKYTLEFYGGMAKFKYYTIANLLTNKGFIKDGNVNDGYSTQDKYVRGNLRTNLDVELTPTTHMKANIWGMLDEQNQPGSQADLWGMVYAIPSLAYPIKDERGFWGGSAAWDGNKNPVAQATGAGYYKQHSRAIYTDLTIKQDLSAVTPGLGLTARLAYDNFSTLYEDHSKVYASGMSSVQWLNGQPDYTALSRYEKGQDGTLGGSSDSKSYKRHFQFDAGIDYDHTFGQHSVYSQLNWQYQFRDTQSGNSAIYHQYFTWFTHYGFRERYYLDLALNLSGTNKLAKGDKWSLAPTVSAAWLMSKERFMRDVKWIDLLKLRASVGTIDLDLLPGDDSDWLYAEQNYSTGHGNYPFNQDYTGTSSTEIGRMPVTTLAHEWAHKYNVGLDARLFGQLGVTFDAFYQERTRIFVLGNNYSSLVGVSLPYTNHGRVNSWGWELGLDYSKQIGQVTLSAAGRFNYNRNQIKAQDEEPRLYPNLVETGNALSQVYGLVAEGLFQSQAEVDVAPRQTFGTYGPGDIRYKDVNGDGIIDANDKTKIGYATAPSIYWSAQLGAEYKGFGLYALVQGTGRYSCNLSSSYYLPTLMKHALSEYAYNNRWTPENPNASLPRLSTTATANNTQGSTFWLRNRSFVKLRDIELYYNFPKAFLQKTKLLSAAKLYVRGTDLFTSDHLDEADAEGYGTAQPMTRSVAMGLQVTF